MTLPPIKGFLETSFSDWPGKVAAVVFLPGCPYRCPYCHNHRLVTDPGSLADWPLESVLGRLDRLRQWVDGVCVTGGEPTGHADLGGLLERFRGEGWPVKLDTNGSRPRTVARLLARGQVDAWAVDVKAPLEPVPYLRNAGRGGDPDRVAETLANLVGAAAPLHLRTTVHPALLSREELVRLAADLGVRCRPHPGPVRYTVQPCRVDDPLEPELGSKAPLEPGAFDRWAAEAGEMFRRTQAGFGRGDQAADKAACSPRGGGAPENP